MKSFSGILVVCAAAGLLGGLLLGGVTGQNSRPAAESDADMDQVGLSARSTREVDSSSSSSQISRPRSRDTLESLMTAPADELYSRLALWLMTADEEEIAAYWDHFLTKEEQPRPIIDLVMIGWTRVNPEGAMAAVKGGSYEHFAWWAWACHDPARALEVGLAEKTEYLSTVMWGLGEFHPKWVREHWDSLPGDSRSGTIPGIVKWAPTDDPMATMEFLKTIGATPPVGMLRYLVRQDPQAAYDWFEANSAEIGRSDGSADEAYSLIGQALAKDAPGLLDDLIAKTPAGNRRFQLESAAMEQMIKDDPNSALARARANSDPAMATHFMAKAGLEFAREDPDRAFELMSEIFKQNTAALSLLRLETGGENQGSSQSVRSDVQTLLSALSLHSPERAVESFLTLEDMQAKLGATAKAVALWARQDVDALSDWVDRNPSKLPKDIEMMIPRVLAGDDRVGDALNWSLARSSDQTGEIPRLYQNWQQRNPAEAREWLDSANLNAEQRKQFDALANPTQSPR